MNNIYHPAVLILTVYSFNTSKQHRIFSWRKYESYSQYNHPHLNPPEEPAKSKLDYWYFRSSCHQVDTRTSVPFFPDAWSAPKSARVHSATQAMFSQVNGAEAHGYVRMPPVEETVAAHLCPASAKTMDSDISLPSKPCRLTAHLASKAYSSAGEGASALHAMAVLQVFQAKLLQSLEGGTASPEAVNVLRAATDFAQSALPRRLAEPWGSW